MSMHDLNWTEVFEGFLLRELEEAEMSHRNLPCGITRVRPHTLKLVLDAFRWHKSEGAKNESCDPSCIKNPISHFDRLVKFVEEVKQDSLRGHGVANEAAVAVCDGILKHADHIRRC